MRPYRLPDYLVSGESDTTLYMLHGAYGSKEYFRYTIDRFVRAGYRVVASDAPPQAEGVASLKRTSVAGV